MVLTNTLIITQHIICTSLAIKISHMNSLALLLIQIASFFHQEKLAQGMPLQTFLLPLICWHMT